MTRRILIECGAADTRAALMEGDEALAFHFGPARGDEALPRPANLGDLYSARIRTVSKPLGGAFADLGAGRDGFLPFRAGAAPVEGETLIVRVRRPALGAKGPVVSADWSNGLSAEAIRNAENAAARMTGPGAVGAPIDAAVNAFLSVIKIGSLSKVETIIDIPDPAAALRAYGAAPVTVEVSPFESAGADVWFDEAFERTVVLRGGGRLVFDECEALTIIDVDAGGAAHGATGALNDKVNAAAGRRVFRDLARRRIGGRIVIDFLPPSGAKARGELLSLLSKECLQSLGGRVGKLSVDGLLDCTAPRNALSLLEEASESAGEDLLRAGRAFTLDWCAKAAIAATERALKQLPSARLKVFAGEALAAYLGEKRPQWATRIATRYGARFAIIADRRQKERDFDIAEQ